MSKKYICKLSKEKKVTFVYYYFRFRDVVFASVALPNLRSNDPRRSSICQHDVDLFVSYALVILCKNQRKKEQHVHTRTYYVQTVRNEASRRIRSNIYKKQEMSCSYKQVKDVRWSLHCFDL